MPICHLLLSMPAIALVSFFVLPLGPALGVYLSASAVSLGIYYLVFRAMRQPVRVGKEDMMGATVEVVRRLGDEQGAQYLVRCQGEIWNAVCAERLRPGDRARVVSMQGIRPVLQRAEKVGN